MQFQDVCVFLSLLAPPSLAVPFESGLDNTLQRRGSCDAWTTETDYTKLSDSTQVVSDMMRGPQRLTVNWGRAQSWTYSFGKEDAADVAVLGTGIAKNFKTARNDTSKYVFEIQAGEMGTVGFTPTLDCAKGLSLKSKQIHWYRELTRNRTHNVWWKEDTGRDLLATSWP